MPAQQAQEQNLAEQEKEQGSSALGKDPVPDSGKSDGALWESNAGQDFTPPDPNVPSPNVTAEQTPSPVPLKKREAFTHVNYAHSFPLLSTEHGKVFFHYDDTVTIENADGRNEISLSSLFAGEQKAQSFDDPEAWFFCGALESDGLVYAHYDYLDGRTPAPSMLLQIDPATGQIQCSILSQNPKKKFNDAFAIMDGMIYYTRTTYDGRTAGTGIFRADPNGNEETECIPRTLGETIPFLTSDGNFLYFTVSTDAETRLICYDPASGGQTLLAGKMNVPDFLVAVNGFALTSTADNILRYYSKDGSAMSVSLTQDTSVTAEHPFTDGIYAYVPLANNSGSASTRLAIVDLPAGEVIREIILSEEAYYCIGMTEEAIYVEDGEEMKIFPFSEIE